MVYVATVKVCKPLLHAVTLRINSLKATCNMEAIHIKGAACSLSTPDRKL